jgi:hypothetical protein
MTAAASYPLDGPHTPDTVVGAARGVDNLVRYLTHATRSRVLDDPADLHQVLGGLGGAVLNLPQLFDQLATQAGRYTTLPGLCDNHGGNPAATAQQLHNHLRDAWDRTLRLVDPIRAAHDTCARLGAQHRNGEPE